MSSETAKRMAALAGAMAASLGLAAGAQAGSLVKPYFGTPPKVTPEVGTLRQQVAAVDKLAITNGHLADTVTLNLFPDVAVTLKRTGETRAFGGGWIWTGTSTSGVAAEGTLVVKGGRVTGQVTAKRRIFEIDPYGANGAHVIREVKPAAVPPSETAPAGAAPRAAAASVAKIGDGTTGTEITLLVAYTDAVYGRYPDILPKINLAVSNANGAFARSKVPIQFKLAGTLWAQYYDERRLQELVPDENINDNTCPTTFKEDEFTEIDYKKNLKYARLGCSYLDVLPAERNRVKADLVTLIVNRNELCAHYYVPAKMTTPVTPVSAAGAYSVVSVGCLGTYSLSTATGGNMGLQKDRFVTYPGLKGYAFGFVDLVSRNRDIMSDNARCEAAGVTCQTLNAFSNPDIVFDRRPFGIPAGQPYAADGARALTETRATVAAFR